MSSTIQKQIIEAPTSDNSCTVERVEPYLPTMKWLVENHYECEVELAALETTVRMHPDSPERNRFLEALSQLRPKTNLPAQ